VLMTTMATATKAASPGRSVLMTSGKTSACTRAQGMLSEDARLALQHRGWAMVMMSRC
jgi:hypothetical protein